VTTRRRAPNTRLRALIEETGWTNENFARAVNHTAAEAGTTRHYDRTTVSHWLTGSRPNPPMPAFIAETLSRRLGRPITPHDAGLTPADQATTPDECPPDPRALTQLLWSDLDPARRSPLRSLPYHADWTVLPEQPAPLDSTHRAGTPARWIGLGEVDALREVTAAFARVDRAFGGGHARAAVAAYLATDVSGWLQADAHDDIRKELLGATATLVYLLGFMSFDSLYHNLAQRYYRIAQHLALQGDNSTVHAIVLRGMSIQAAHLGHDHHAARLADAAVDTTGPTTPPCVRSAVLGQAAVAHAALSHRRRALSLLAQAEKHLDKSTPTTTDIGSASQADLVHHKGQVLTFFRDLRQAELAFSESVRLRTDHERRSRMLTLHHLADLQLRRGRVEHACATLQRFLGEYSRMHSARISTALTAVRTQLLPHLRNPNVRRVLHQTAAAHDPNNPDSTTHGDGSPGCPARSPSATIALHDGRTPACRDHVTTTQWTPVTAP
jgi:hypothetical protein